jgi:hypothetical protein
VSGTEIPIAGDLVSIAGRRKPVRVADVYWCNGSQIEITTVDGRLIYAAVELVHRVVEAAAATSSRHWWEYTL